MASMFNNLFGEPTTNDPKAEEGEQRPGVPSDVEIPDGEDMPPVDEMKRVIQLAEASIQSPTTPRPGAERTESMAQLGEANNSSPGEKNYGDPPHDLLSLDTDINRHQESIDEIYGRMRKLETKIDAIVDMDTTIRKMAKEVEEMAARSVSARTEIEQLRKSFNMYQSATANKIADVERRSAERQLRADASPEESLVPPEVVHASRDETPSLNTQPQTLAKAAISKAPVKVANLSDW